MWKVIARYLDAGVAHAWDDFTGGELLRDEFVAQYRGELQYFVEDEDAFTEVLDAVENGETIPARPLGVTLHSSNTLRNLFASEALTADFNDFVSRADRHIDGLEHRPFDQEGVENVKTIMYGEVDS